MTKPLMVCTPKKLNYGKAAPMLVTARVLVCTPKKLNYGKAAVTVSSV